MFCIGDEKEKKSDKEVLQSAFFKQELDISDIKEIKNISPINILEFIINHDVKEEHILDLIGNKIFDQPDISIQKRLFCELDNAMDYFLKISKQSNILNYKTKIANVTNIMEHVLTQN